MVELHCCQQDRKTWKGYIEHYLNVHAGRVPPWDDPYPDHDHRHFKCCGQHFCGEPRFRKHVAVAHAGVDVDEIRELAPELLGDLPDELKEDGEEAAEEAAAEAAEEPAEAKAASDEAAGEEEDLSDLSPKERAIQRAKQLARKKREEGG